MRRRSPRIVRPPANAWSMPIRESPRRRAMLAADALEAVQNPNLAGRRRRRWSDSSSRRFAGR